jgi:hypothetical protein
MTQPRVMLVTSEMMQKGVVPLFFTGGALQYSGRAWAIRNGPRPLAAGWIIGVVIF